MSCYYWFPRSQNMSAHPYARFLQTTYRCEGVQVDRWGTSFFKNGYQTDFIAIGHKLKRLDAQKNGKACENITRRWLKQLHFEAKNNVRHKNKEGEVIRLHLIDNQLVQALAFTRAAMSIVLPNVPVFAVEDRLLYASLLVAQVRQMPAVTSYLEKHVSSCEPLVAPKCPSPCSLRLFVMAEQKK